MTNTSTQRNEPLRTPEDLPLVLLSHRAPVTFDRGPDGRTASRGSGGLVSALMGLAEHLDDAVWVCAASSDEDRAVVAEAKGEAVEVALSVPRLVEDGEQVDGPRLNVRMVELDPAQHERFYTVVANPLLWFVQHGLYGLADSPSLTRADHEAVADGYVPVNNAVADAVIAEVQARGGRALVMLQDYHFYLVAERVREACPDAVLSHFVHIPWPPPDGWRVLPPPWRDQLLRGLLGNDVVGFHTSRNAHNFLLCVEDVLGLEVDHEQRTVRVGERTVAVRHYPISVDIPALEAVAAAEGTQRHREALQSLLLDPATQGRRLVLRVDRTDPSKNILRGFQAFGAMLDDHPELASTVTFLALLQPSRQDVPEYGDYLGSIGAAVAEVNARHGGSGRQPVDLRLVEDLELAVAAYSLCDVLLVNPIADGMNLVAKEAPLVNTRDMVLALSENAGAHEELGGHAVTLYPFDIQQQADGLYEALTMAADERARRCAAAAQVVRDNDVRRWLELQLADMGTVAQREG